MSKFQKTSSINFHIPLLKFTIKHHSNHHQNPLNHFFIFINLLTYKYSSHSSQFHTPKVLLSCQRTFLSSPNLACVDDLFFSSPSFFCPFGISPFRNFVTSVIFVHLVASFFYFLAFYFFLAFLHFILFLFNILIIIIYFPAIRMYLGPM